MIFYSPRTILGNKLVIPFFSFMTWKSYLWSISWDSNFKKNIDRRLCAIFGTSTTHLRTFLFLLILPMHIKVFWVASSSMPAVTCSTRLGLTLWCDSSKSHSSLCSAKKERNKAQFERSSSNFILFWSILCRSPITVVSCIKICIWTAALMILNDCTLFRHPLFSLDFILAIGITLVDTSRTGALG